MANEDLKPNEHRTQITPAEVWTMCELVIYRFRDKTTRQGQYVYGELEKLAAEISELEKAWRPKD